MDHPHRTHELANAVGVVQACVDFVAAHPTRKGDTVDAAIADAKAALETINRIVHELVSERARDSKA